MISFTEADVASLNQILTCRVKKDNSTGEFYSVLVSSFYNACHSSNLIKSERYQASL